MGFNLSIMKCKLPSDWHLLTSQKSFNLSIMKCKSTYDDGTGRLYWF